MTGEWVDTDCISVAEQKEEYELERCGWDACYASSQCADVVQM